MIFPIQYPLITFMVKTSPVEMVQPCWYGIRRQHVLRIVLVVVRTRILRIAMPVYLDPRPQQSKRLQSVPLLSATIDRHRLAVRRAIPWKYTGNTPKIDRHHHGRIIAKEL